MRKKEIWILAAILLLGGCLRLFHLDTVFLNRDEPLHQIRISYQPLPYVLKYNNGPLFSLLVHFLLPLGPLEIMARAVPFLSGLLSILLAFLLGRSLFTSSIGLIAALFTACNPLLLFYSQNSRTYTLTTALFLAAALFLVRAVGSGRNRDWILYALTLALCLYTHTIALLVIPPFALFAAVAWREQWRKGRPPAAGPGGGRIDRRFLVWTGSAAGLAILCYLPCAWMLDMFKGSMRLGIDQAQAAKDLSLRGIFDILRLEISPVNQAIFILTMLLTAAGCFVRAGRERRSVLLAGAAIVFPWLVFLLGNPRENDITSLYRYLQHLIPLIFILSARGILILASALEALVRRIHGKSGIIRISAAWAITAVLGAGYLANLGGYQYTDFWRRGSYRFDREVKTALQDRVDRDALLYIDSYPAASQLILMNPLSKDMKFEAGEIAAREDFVRRSGADPVMIFTVGWAYLPDFVANRKIELWAVTPAGPDKAESLRAAAAAMPGFEFFELSKFSLLHFKKDEAPLAEKMAGLSDLLISWTDGDSVLRRQRLIFAAQSFLLSRTATEAQGAMRAFDGESISAREDAANAGSTAERLIGLLLGIGPREFRALIERRSLAEIQDLLLAYGRNMIEAGNLGEARLAFEIFLNSDAEDKNRAIEPLIVLGDLFEKSAKAAQALQAWEAAARLSPNREDVASRIAGIRGKLRE